MFASQGKGAIEMMKQRICRGVVLAAWVGAGIHAARADDPWDHGLLAGWSLDGIHFQGAGLFEVAAGVPCLTEGPAGELVATFQWFDPVAFDEMARRVSLDGGRTWSDAEPLVLSGAPGRFVNPVDPALVVLNDGRWRLYFTSAPAGSRSADTYSAISSDGLNFQWEAGARFQIDGEFLLDPAVAWFGGLWHLYLPRHMQGDGAFYATSSDGLNFERQDDVEVPGILFLGNPLVHGEDLVFYGGGPRGVAVLSSSDGSRWREEASILAPVGDPAVIRSRDGVYLALATDLRR